MWLALCLEHWALDHRVDGHEPTARVVVEPVAQRQQVRAASREALRAGVHRGMDLADARMRMAALEVHERCIVAEARAMTRLAGWAWGYSHQVHGAIQQADIEHARLVFEIGASLRLFGGRRALLARIRQDLRTLGYRYRAGLGATPHMALAFARADSATRRRADPAHLPLSSLGLPVDVLATLHASGMYQLGTILSLPPGTLQRRFGSGLLKTLERLRGRRAHGLTLYRPPERYTAQHELNGVLETAESVVFVLQRVFDELALFLRGVDSAIQALRIELAHESLPPTRLWLQLAAPTNQARHLTRIAHQRLSQTTLAAPVLAISLTSDKLRPFEHRQQAFWHGATASDEDDRLWPAVLDRLRARLGEQSVAWVSAGDDHRPEHASCLQPVPPDSQETARSRERDLPPRPLWLFDTPEPIAASRLARLRWISGPERIEGGWWARDCRRDYYRAIDPAGQLFWVFQDLKPRHDKDRYYLHGLFG